MNLRQKSISRKKKLYTGTSTKNQSNCLLRRMMIQKVFFHNDDDDHNDEVDGGDEKALTSEAI